MSSVKALRASLIVMWTSIALSIIFALTLEKQLPLPLQDWIRLKAEKGPTDTEGLIITVLLVMIILNLLASARLYMLKGGSEKLFVFTISLMIILQQLLGPVVVHGTVYVFDTISSMTAGVVLGICFFTDALPRDG